MGSFKVQGSKVQENAHMNISSAGYMASSLQVIAATAQLSVIY